LNGKSSINSGDDNKQSGGAGAHSMPTYKEPINSPFITNEQKAIRIAEKYPAQVPQEEQKPTSTFDKNEKEFWQGYEKNDQSRKTNFTSKLNNLADIHDDKNPMKPILSLEMFEPGVAKPKQPEPNPFNPINTLPFTALPQLYAPYATAGLGYTQVPNYNIPVIKNYTINAGGTIDTNHAKIFDLYEEILPTKDVANTPNSIGERINMYQFIRSVFVKHEDGEDIDLTGNSVNSLLKHIKTIELNPNNPNIISDNPYRGLPDNMLVYKSCYPIRYNPANNTSQCSPASLGMIVRIYGLSMAEYQTRNIAGQEYYKSDTWREIGFYEYIREEIIKQKVCPNFVILHCYHIDQNCPVDFVKINMLKNNSSDVMNYFVGNQVINRGAVDKNWLEQITNYYNKMVDLTTLPTLPYLKNVMSKDGYFKMVKPIVENNMFLRNYSGKALVTFSEAPTYNLLDWASKKYVKSDNFKVHAMTNTGFHDSSIWKSIIFQIMAAMCTLQIHNIAFTNFSVIDNINIQDTKTHPNNTMHWKYIINGVEYFVPNYGFLVLIDSNFKDIKSEYSTNPSANKVYKITSSIYDDEDNNIFADKDDIQEKCVKAFLNVINPNVFTNSFVTNGGTKPPEDILRMLTTINNDVNNMLRLDPNIKLSSIIFKHANFFINNRIGTILTLGEIPSIQKSNTDKFSPGQIIVREYKNDTYDFVLFKEYVSETSARVVTDILKKDAEKKQLVEIVVDTSNVYHYAIHDKINQKYTNKINFNEEYLLETYIINDQ